MEATIHPGSKVDIKLSNALNAWQRWFQARLDRINAGGSSEGYTGYEMDLLEAIYNQSPLKE